MKAKYKKELLKRAKHSSVGEKRILSTSTVSSIFNSKEVVDISVINLENIKLWRFLRAKRIDDCMCTPLRCPQQGVFVDAKFLRRWPF